MPQISVIIPVYNVKDYLEGCLNSILQQTFRDFEIILVDDGSSDGSSELCDVLEKTHPCIRVIHKQNGGPSSARNLGVDQARGEFVAFVDADDELYEDAYETMINGMNKKGVDYVFTGMTWMDGERRIINTSERLVEKVFDKQQILDYFRRPLYSRIIPGAVLGFFRKSILDEHHIRFREDIYSKEDFLFNTEYVIAMPGKAFMTTHPTYMYMLRGNSATASMPSTYNERFPTGFDATVRIVELMKEHHLKLPIITEDLIKTYRRVRDYYLHFGKNEEAKQLKHRFFAIVPPYKFYWYRFKRFGINTIKKIIPLSLFKKIKIALSNT